jgi:hypothetical protein
MLASLRDSLEQTKGMRIYAEEGEGKEQKRGSGVV